MLLVKTTNLEDIFSKAVFDKEVELGQSLAYSPQTDHHILP
jgi:hypothetical protein